MLERNTLEEESCAGEREEGKIGSEHKNEEEDSRKSVMVVRGRRRRGDREKLEENFFLPLSQNFIEKKKSREIERKN